MKYRIIATAAVAATGASAQAQYGSSSSPPPASSSAVSPISSAPSSSASYVTVTYDDCPSQSIETLITVTNGVTVTFCPECHHDLTSSKTGPAHTTVYTTVYQSLCSTGLVPATYTVTEECDEPTPTWASSKADHVPQGFTVTVMECHVCDKTPVPVTITEPCKDGCGHHTPAPTGGSGGMASQAPEGQGQAPGPSGSTGGQSPGGQSPGGQSPNGGGQAPAPSGGPSTPGGSGSTPGGSGSTPGGSGGNGSGPNRMPESSGDEHCPGPQCSKPAGEQPAPGGSASNGATPPYPTGSSGEDDKCPGPQCKAHGTDSASTPANSGDTSNIEPYTPGSAGTTVTSLGFVSSVCMAAAVAVLAFAL